MKLLVMIPAYNEEKNIVNTVTELISTCPGCDYVVINDGSKDGTEKLCRENGFNLIDLSVNTGLAGAVKAGFRYAMEKGYDMALQYDGDGQHDASYIPAMVKKMQEDGLDIVIGSRCVEKNTLSDLRKRGSSFLKGIIRLTTGQTVTDPTSGMRLFNRAMIKEFAMNLNYGPEPDTIAYLMRRGVKVGEVPVTMRERVAGKSYLSSFKAVEYMWHMFLSILFIQWFRTREVR